LGAAVTQGVALGSLWGAPLALKHGRAHSVGAQASVGLGGLGETWKGPGLKPGGWVVRGTAG